MPDELVSVTGRAGFGDFVTDRDGDRIRAIGWVQVVAEVRFSSTV